MKIEEIKHEIIVFNWDEGNISKNWEKHRVKIGECEDVFYNDDTLVMEPDSEHSVTEQRYSAFGRTDIGRLLAIVFTIRENKIRVISARDMNKKERRDYHERIKKDTKVQK